MKKGIKKNVYQTIKFELYDKSGKKISKHKVQIHQLSTIDKKL